MASVNGGRGGETDRCGRRCSRRSSRRSVDPADLYREAERFDASAHGDPYLAGAAVGLRIVAAELSDGPELRLVRGGRG
jgi:hypothetical protein